MKIQSIVRRWLIFRKYDRYETNRKECRLMLLNEAMDDTYMSMTLLSCKYDMKNKFAKDITSYIKERVNRFNNSVTKDELFFNYNSLFRLVDITNQRFLSHPIYLYFLLYILNVNLSYSEAVVVVEQLDKNTGLVTYNDGLLWFKNNFLKLNSFQGKIARVYYY